MGRGGAGGLVVGEDVGAAQPLNRAVGASPPVGGGYGDKEKPHYPKKAGPVEGAAPPKPAGRGPTRGSEELAAGAPQGAHKEGRVQGKEVQRGEKPGELENLQAHLNGKGVVPR